jgi:hypothetical protein
LRTPRPFDSTGNKLTYGLRGTYNDQSRYTTPSGFLLGTAQFGEFGITLGVSKSGNRTRRGGFESTGQFFNEQANIDFNSNSAFNNNFNPGGVAIGRGPLQTPGRPGLINVGIVTPATITAIGLRPWHRPMSIVLHPKDGWISVCIFQLTLQRGQPLAAKILRRFL